MMTEYLYHYTSAPTAIDHILQNQTFRFGRVGRVNDPKESKFRDFTFYVKTGTGAKIFQFSNFDDVIADIAENTYIGCFGLDDGEDEGFNKGALRPHMWAHYGGNHKGVCIVFDKDLLREQVRIAAGANSLFEGQVFYHDWKELRSNGVPALSLYFENWDLDKFGYLDHHIKNYYRSLFFEKYKSWEVEKEYRWVIRSREARDFDVDVSGCISRVIVGSDITEKDLDTIKLQCLALGIPVHKVAWNQDSSLTENLHDLEYARNMKDIGCMISRSIPCKSVFLRINNGAGEAELMAFGNNQLIYGGSGAVEDRDELLNGLGYTEADMSEKYIPNGFSAGRYAETETRPLQLDFTKRPPVAEGEEQPYYGLRIEFVEKKP